MDTENPDAALDASADALQDTLHSTLEQAFGRIGSGPTRVDTVTALPPCGRIDETQQEAQLLKITESSITLFQTHIGIGTY